MHSILFRSSSVFMFLLPLPTSNPNTSCCFQEFSVCGSACLIVCGVVHPTYSSESSFCCMTQDAPEGYEVLVTRSRDKSNGCSACYYSARGSFPHVKTHELKAAMDEHQTVEDKSRACIMMTHSLDSFD